MRHEQLEWHRAARYLDEALRKNVLHLFFLSSSIGKARIGREDDLHTLVLRIGLDLRTHEQNATRRIRLSKC